MSKKYINTLEFYGYGENNRMEPALGPSYKVKVSDKDGNIITIEKDDSLYACVRLAFDTNSGVLSLLDAAHNDSVLAEIEMPNADYIYNCRYDESLNAILFDVKSLYGNDTDTIELDVDSLVELYEAGQGIEIGEKNEETGRKPISVKVAEGEELLTLTDEGLGIDDSVVTEDELQAAISGKADVDYVDDLFGELSGLTSGITELAEIVEEHEEEIEKLKKIVGTDEEIPSLFEQIENNREEIAEIDDEIGELSGTVDTLSEDVETVKVNVSTLSGDIESLDEAVESEIERATSAETELQASIDAEAGRAISAETELSAKIDAEKEERKAEAVADVNYDSSAKTISFFNGNDEVIASIDATDFIKDGMIDSVVLETVDDTTYLVITWNTDAGKEVTRIDIGDLFEADNYYTKSEIDEKVTALQEMDAALANVDTQQWAVINQNRLDMETVDRQLWEAIANETEGRRNADLDLRNALSDETNARTTADQGLQSQIDVEKEERENKDTELQNAIAAEKAARIYAVNAVREEINTKVTEERNRAIEEEANLQSQITAETQRAQREEQRIETKYDDDIAELRNADRVLKQYVMDQDADIHRRIDGVVRDLDDAIDVAQARDRELAQEIRDIRDAYATITYVDTQDEHFKEAAIQTSTGYAKSYTDTEIDSLEAELKQYCDSGHTELQHEISDNTTKINAISNLRGVTGSDTSNYDDSGNGILDVLHREFHEHIEHDGQIENIYYEDGKLIIIYNTPTGEKRTEIPVEDVVDLTNYYNKAETDSLLAEKLDASAYTDISEQVIENKNNIEAISGSVENKVGLDVFNALVDKLGYTDNETLVRKNEHEASFGEYNISNTSEDPSGKTIFSIGNGTSDENRSNALEVRENGDVYLWVEGEFMNINKILAQIAHEIYDSDSATHNTHFFDGE